MWTRRSALAGLAASIALLPGSALGSAASPILVLVQLRGGWDGLAVVPPHGDPEYARARGRLAKSPPDILDLDGFFGLHAALAPLQPWYRDGELLPVHAIATPFIGRSHFDAQEVLETGATKPGELRDGWLNRLCARVPGATAVALGPNLPLVLRGAHPVRAFDPTRDQAADPSVMDDLAELYRGDPALQAALAAARDSAEFVDGAPRESRDVRLVSAGAQVAADLSGPALLHVELGGWDTHAQQEGALTARLRGLADGLVRLRAALGPAWSRTVVVVVSEFGRTVLPNGTSGSDHGRATVALVAGGRVAGGRILTDWPGLRLADRWEGRDLRPTRDVRAILAAVAAEHLDPREMGSIFPGVRPFSGILRG